jgi:hypothetical protein
VPCRLVERHHKPSCCGQDISVPGHFVWRNCVLQCWYHQRQTIPMVAALMNTCKCALTCLHLDLHMSQVWILQQDKGTASVRLSCMRRRVTGPFFLGPPNPWGWRHHTHSKRRQPQHSDTVTSCGSAWLHIFAHSPHEHHCV